MAHEVKIKEIINGVQITETLDGNVVVKLISYQSKPFLRTTNESAEETYQVLDIVGEIYNTPALSTDFRIIDKNGAVFIPANGIQLIEYSKKIRAFRPDDDGFSYHIGEITGTSNSITIGLANDNVNWAYIDGSFFEKYYPDTFNFTPVNPGETKTFLIYAKADSQTFYLTQSTGIPPGTYLIASVTVNEAGIDIIQATSGFREKAVDNFAIFSLSAGDRVIGIGANMRLKVQSYGVVRIGGFVNEEDKLYNGCPISVRNDTPFPIEFYNAVDSTPEFIAINSADLPFSIKPGETANFAYRGGGIVEIIKTGGSASFPETGSNADVLVKDSAVDGGVKWSNRLTTVETGKLDKPTVTSDFTTHPNIVAVDGAGNSAMVSAGGTNFMALLFADNAKWFFPNQNAATYSFFRANSANIVLQGQTAKLNGQAMPGIVYTSNASTLAFQRGAPMAFRNETAWKFVRKFEINTAVSGQRVLVALANGYVSAAPTNVAMSTLIQLVGICMQNSSNNIFVINNDGSGTAVLTDTGYTNDINCYYLLTITKNIAGTLMTVKLDKYSNTTGYISSFTHNITSDIPTSTLLYPAIWCVDSATTSAVIVTDYGSYEEQRLAGI